MKYEFAQHSRLTEAERAAAAERNNFLVLRGWYLAGGLWTHPKHPTTEGVDPETAQRLQEEWEASA